MLAELNLEAGQTYQVNEDIILQPGRNVINFLTDQPPFDPPGEDNRLLLFSIEKVHPFYLENDDK